MHQHQDQGSETISIKSGISIGPDRGSSLETNSFSPRCDAHPCRNAYDFHIGTYDSCPTPKGGPDGKSMHFEGRQMGVVVCHLEKCVSPWARALGLEPPVVNISFINLSPIAAGTFFFRGLADWSIYSGATIRSAGEQSTREPKLRAPPLYAAFERLRLTQEALFQVAA